MFPNLHPPLNSSSPLLTLSVHHGEPYTCPSSKIPAHLSLSFLFFLVVYCSSFFLFLLSLCFFTYLSQLGLLRSSCCTAGFSFSLTQPCVFSTTCAAPHSLLPTSRSLIWSRQPDASTVLLTNSEDREQMASCCFQNQFRNLVNSQSSRSFTRVSASLLIQYVLGWVNPFVPASWLNQPIWINSTQYILPKGHQQFLIDKKNNHEINLIFPATRHIKVADTCRELVMWLQLVQRGLSRTWKLYYRPLILFESTLVPSVCSCLVISRIVALSRTSARSSSMFPVPSRPTQVDFVIMMTMLLDSSCVCFSKSK